MLHGGDTDLKQSRVPMFSPLRTGMILLKVPYHATFPLPMFLMFSAPLESGIKKKQQRSDHVRVRLICPCMVLS